MYDPLRAKAKIALYTVVAFLFGLGLASGMGWTRSTYALPTVEDTPQVSAAAVAPARDLSAAFVNLAHTVTPAVVRIQSRLPAQADEQQVPDIFRRFFDVPRGGQGQGESPPSQGQLAGGSGFIFSPDGYILTNNHVVEGADQILVYLPDRRYFQAKVIGADPYTDVAVIKIDAGTPLPTMSLGNSDNVKVGEWVLAIGNPGFGSSTQLDYTVTAGIVSARGRGLGLLQDELYNDPKYGPSKAPYAIENFIQTDAVINPGNSGGPMVDLDGQVVGINSAIASRTGYYVGYGFAIPINLARRVMEDLVKYGHVQRPLIGVNIADVAAEDAQKYKLPRVSGVLVQDVTPKGPSDGKLEPEDVIVAIDGQPVGYASELQARVAEHHPGDQLKLEVYRKGNANNPIQVTVKLGEAPINDRTAKTATAEVHAEDRLGINVQPLDDQLAQRLGYQKAGGVVISAVAQASPADQRHVPVGFKLMKVNDTPVSTPAEVRRALEKVKGGDIVSLHLEDQQEVARVINIRMPS